MTSITVNAEVLTALQQANGAVKVHDANGKAVGFFYPFDPEQVREYALAIAQFEAGNDDFDPQAELPADFDMAEMERQFALKDRGSRLWEVFERLKAITSDPATRDRLQADIHRLREEGRCDLLCAL